ncbi:hypothetical protein L7F22_062028 [Adiantum nelumboides]|nr:hypothetical protein [Adiantum nelumboides]
MDHCVASHLFRTLNILAQMQSVMGTGSGSKFTTEDCDETHFKRFCREGQKSREAMADWEEVEFLRPEASAKYEETTMDSLDCLSEGHFQPILQFTIFPSFQIKGSIVVKSQFLRPEASAKYKETPMDSLDCISEGHFQPIVQFTIFPGFQIKGSIVVKSQGRAKESGGNGDWEEEKWFVHLKKEFVNACKGVWHLQNMVVAFMMSHRVEFLHPEASAKYDKTIMDSLDCLSEEHVQPIIQFTMFLGFKNKGSIVVKSQSNLQEELDVKLDVLFEKLLNVIDGVSKQLQTAFEGLHERVDCLQASLAYDYNLGWKRMKDHPVQVRTPRSGLTKKDTRLGRSANGLNSLEEAVEVVRENIRLLMGLLIIVKDADLMLERDFQDRQAMDHCVASHLFRTSNILARTQSERAKESEGNGGLEQVEFLRTEASAKYDETTMDSLNCISEGHFQPIVQFTIFLDFQIEGSIVVKSQRSFMADEREALIALHKVSLQEELDVKLDVQFERLLHAIDDINKQFQTAFEGLHERVDCLQASLADDYNSVWKKMKDRLDQVGTPDSGLRKRGTRLGRFADVLNSLKKTTEVAREDIRLLTGPLIVEKDADLMLKSLNVKCNGTCSGSKFAIEDCDETHFKRFCREGQKSLEAMAIRTKEEKWYVQLKKEFVNACKGVWHLQNMVVAFMMSYRVEFVHPEAGVKYDKTTMDSLDWLSEEHFQPIVQFTIFPGFKNKGSIVV